MGTIRNHGRGVCRRYDPPGQVKCQNPVGVMGGLSRRQRTTRVGRRAASAPAFGQGGQATIRAVPRLVVAGFWESSKDGKMRRRNFMTTNQRKTLAKATRSFGTLG